MALMKFCPKCGFLLKPKQDKLVCSNCGYEEEKGKEAKITTKEKIPEKIKTGILKEEAMAYPVTAATCPKCGHKEAYFWSVQTRAADEAETSFFRCTKCKHTWREYR